MNIKFYLVPVEVRPPDLSILNQGEVTMQKWGTSSEASAFFKDSVREFLTCLSLCLKETIANPHTNPEAMAHQASFYEASGLITNSNYTYWHVYQYV